MKPPPFGYVAPTTVDEALDALAEPGAVVLAGGQSLVLELVYRQQRPALLVDINGVAGLDALVDGPDGLSIAALVRHRRLEDDEAGSPVRRLLTRVAPYVAHPPIRTRGTFCGSVAWAHPAAEWNAVLLAFDGSVTLRSRRGDRVVPAAEWFRGVQQTVRRTDELVTGVAFPPQPSGTGTGFAEHRRTHASFAEVAVVAAVTTTPDGRVERARLAVAGVDDRPLRLARVEESVAGLEVAGLSDAVRRLVDVPADAYRTAVAAELAGRAVAEAVAAA